MVPPAVEGTHHDREDPERVARGLVRLAQSHRQLCADFLRDHRDGMDTPAVAKFAARIRMFDRVIASASLALSNLPDDNNDRHAMLRATIDSMAEDTTADLMPLEVPQQGLQHVQEGPGDRPALPLAWLPVPGAPGARVGGNAGIGVATQWLGTNE